MTGSPTAPNTFAFPRLSLIIGGARSGKSGFAERLARSAGRPLTYVATGQAHDDEMRARIAAHLKQRGPDWLTIEAPMDVAPALQGARGVVLLDCATLWLTNVLLAGHEIAAEVEALLGALAASPVPVIVVTNEVGLSIVPENALARQFRDEQGRLNQRLAAQADLAVAVWAGLPLVLKGSLPPGLGA